MYIPKKWEGRQHRLRGSPRCRRLGAAGVAIAADLHPRHGDADARIALHLPLELLEKLALHFAHFAAAQASHVNVVARPVAFVIVPVTVNVQQVELIQQAMALEHFERAIDGHAMHPRIHLLRALQQRIGGEVLFGLVHDVQQNAPLPREPHAAA